MMPVGGSARTRWARMRTAVGGVHVGQVEVGELGGDDAALLVVVLNRQPMLHAQRLLPVVCHGQLAVCSQRPIAD